MPVFVSKPGLTTLQHEVKSARQSASNTFKINIQRIWPQQSHIYYSSNSGRRVKRGTGVWGLKAWILQEVWWDYHDGSWSRSNWPFSAFLLLYLFITRSDIPLSQNTYHIQWSGPIALSWKNNLAFSFLPSPVTLWLRHYPLHVSFQSCTGRCPKGISIMLSPRQTGISDTHYSLVATCFESMRQVFYEQIGDDFN